MGRIAMCFAFDVDICGLWVRNWKLLPQRRDEIVTKRIVSFRLRVDFYVVICRFK